MPAINFDDLTVKKSKAVTFEDLIGQEQFGPPEPPALKGFSERVGQRWDERDAQMDMAAELAGQGKIPDAGLNFIAMGNTLGKGLSDVPAEAIVSVGRALPKPVKEFAGNVYSAAQNTPVLGDAMRGTGRVLGAAAEGYDKFKRDHPVGGLYADAALGFGDAALAALPIKGQSIPSRAFDAGQTTAKGTIAAGKKTAQVVGGVVDEAVKPLKRYAPDISPDAVRNLGGDLIGKASKSGAVIQPEAASGFIDDIAGKIAPKGNWEKAATLRTEVDDIVNNLADLRGQPMALEDAMALESRIGNLAYIPKNYTMGKHTPEGRQFLQIKNSLEQMIEKAADTGVVAGDTNAIGAWREGQKYWSASIRARDLDRIIENAQYMDHPATSIRTGMRTLIRNKNKFSKYSPEEQFYIRKAARTGVVTDFYRAGSSLLGPIISGSVGGVAGGAVGGPVGAAIGAAAAAGPSFALREGSKAIATSRQMARANKAYKAVAADAIGLPAKKLTMKQIMALPPEQAKLYLKNIKK